jgi:hypothetical protein
MLVQASLAPTTSVHVSSDTAIVPQTSGVTETSSHFSLAFAVSAACDEIVLLPDVVIEAVASSAAVQSIVADSSNVTTADAVKLAVDSTDADLCAVMFADALPDADAVIADAPSITIFALAVRAKDEDTVDAPRRTRLHVALTDALAVIDADAGWVICESAVMVAVTETCTDPCFTFSTVAVFDATADTDALPSITRSPLTDIVADAVDASGRYALPNDAEPYAPVP